MRLNPVQYCTRLNPAQYCTRLNPVQYCTRLNPMQYCTRFPTLSSDKARHPCNCWQGQPELCQTLVWGKADKPCQVEQKALKEKREKILSHWVLKENWGSLRKFACTIYILYRKEKVHCTSIVPSKEVSKELGTGWNFRIKLIRAIFCLWLCWLGRQQIWLNMYKFYIPSALEPVQFSLLNSLVSSDLSVRLNNKIPEPKGTNTLYKHYLYNLQENQVRKEHLI